MPGTKSRGNNSAGVVMLVRLRFAMKSSCVGLFATHNDVIHVVLCPLFVVINFVPFILIII